MTKECIFITGGAGYIGSILVPILLSQNYKVIVLDNFLFSQTSLLTCCTHPDFQVIRGDCRDKTLLQACLKQADIIIPMAAIVGAPACALDNTAAHSINIQAIELLLDLRHGHQKIIYPTTNSGYGIGTKDSLCTEDTPLNPISLYGTTKVAAERFILAAGQSVSLRLATVFGLSPRMRIDLLVNDFVYRAVNDRAVIVFEGHFKRNYIHIRDVANAFIHVLKHFTQMQNEAYNLGLSTANLSKLELCAQIKKQIPDFVFLEADTGEDPDKRNYTVSNEKIERTGFKPSYSLDVGIAELKKGYTILRNQCYANV